MHTLFSQRAHNRSNTEELHVTKTEALEVEDEKSDAQRTKPILMVGTFPTSETDVKGTIGD